MRFQLTIRALALLLVAAILLGSGAALQAQDADALIRVQDRQLSTKEERERVLAEVSNAAREARDASDWTRAAGFLNRAGRLQIWLHQPEPALASFAEVRVILNNSPESPAYIDSLNGSAAVHTLASKCEDAVELITQARELSERSNYIGGKAEALLQLSDCQNYDNPSLAISTARESLALWQSENDRLGMARAYEAIGHYEFGQTNLAEATKNHEESLKIFRELNVVSEQAEALINLGFVAYRQGAWDDCLSLLTQAQQMLDERAEPYKMGQIVSTIGEAFLENGLPEEALRKIERATEYFLDAKDYRSVSVMRWDLGKVYLAQGKYSDALTNLNQALTDFQMFRDRYREALCNEYLGRTYSAMGDSETALQYLQSALDLYSGRGKRGKIMEAARTSALIGQEYLQQGKLQPARERLNSALNTFEKLADRVNGSATLYTLGKLELKENNLPAAEDYLRRSIEATEDIRRVSTSDDLTTSLSAAVDDRYQTYVECLMRQHDAQPDKGFNVRAFEASESSRGRALAEMLRATGGNFAPGVDAALMERELALRKSRRVKEDYKVKLLASEDKPEQLVALNAEIAQLEKEHTQIVETIQSSYPAFKQITHPQSLSLRKIQEQVITDDNTLMLEFSLGENESYVWAVTRNNLTSYKLPAAARIAEQSDKLYKLLKTQPEPNQSAEAINTATREFAQMILAPVASDLNKQRLIVVAHRALNFIPFQVLSNPKNNEPLIASHDVVNAPSASILAGLSDEGRRRSPGRVLAAFGSPVFESNYSVKANNAPVDVASLQSVDHGRWRQAVRDIGSDGDAYEPSRIQPLFFAGRELANLREVVGEGQSMIAVDFDASRDKLFTTDLTEFSILHFATHGFLDRKRPENSGLVLSTMTRDGKAQNGFVSLQDVYQLRAPAVVVLSACETGLGKDVRGEGLIGLTRGFMYAGASSVVASLWKVDDEATAELMKRFYKNMLEEGMTPATALREAQNSFRQHPSWSAPYYWAGFTLQGDSRQVLAVRQSNRNYVIAFSAGALLLLLGIGAWYYRRRSSST
ncbi:MAG TPA: CHAT domain-containing tetratricopeptide repeat protein [Pyrinomonadaceae bacterium]